ncbi:MAG: DoxX family protein [Gemmatimonadota bacterium]
MPTLTIAAVLQLIVALGLLNVWLLRRGMFSAYRGGQATTLREEFAAYGLPEAAFFVVGGLKITAALMLIAGLWVPALVLPAAVVIIALMLGALAMHVKVGDPIHRSMPAFAVLIMTTAVLLLR